MKPCPTCGVMLAPALADAIANPGNDETCPKGPRKPKKPDMIPGWDSVAPAPPRPTIATLMLMGSLMKETV